MPSFKARDIEMSSIFDVLYYTFVLVPLAVLFPFVVEKFFRLLGIDN